MLDAPVSFEIGADRLGIKNVIEYAPKFGITSNLPRYLPVALGAAEVTLVEQASAYACFRTTVYA